MRYGRAMRVVPVPCLKDNFAYLVIDGDRAAVVDPSEAAPVEAALAREGVTLEAIWLTHHHWDHVGGVAELAAARPGLAVVAGERDAEKIKGVTLKLGDGEETALGELREAPDLVVLFRASPHIPAHADEILALPKQPLGVWMQLGISHPEASERLAKAGITVVEDRCAMVEHGRLFGRQPAH